MALEFRDRVLGLIQTQLDLSLRYRCLLLQTADFSLLRPMCACAEEAAASLGNGTEVIPYTQFIYDVGAISCREVLERLNTASRVHPVLLTGPLNFLTYWSQQTQGVFWKHLAGFAHGPGIIVIDTPREDAVEGPFRFLGKIPGTEVRYLKSRLASTQDGLV